MASIGGTRTMVALVAGLGGIIALASGAQASAPRAARPSTRRRSSARSSSSAPSGEVTLGPLTQIITDPTTGKVTRKHETLSPKDHAALQQAEAKLRPQGSSDYKLLSDEQAYALEDESVERARAEMPGAPASQQEKAKRAAQRARDLMSRRLVPPIPRAPSHVIERDELEQRDDAPKAYVSPPTPINLETARREAPALAKHIRTKGTDYSRQSLRSFQSHAGLTVDGIYGPLSASALKYFGVPNPPKALFKAKPGTVTIYAPAN